MESALPPAVVIADMEAGLEHLSWAGGTLRHVDLLLVVAEPQPKSLLTAARTFALAAQLGIPRLGLVGNRVERAGDHDRLVRFSEEQEVPLVAVVPYDPAVVGADRRGACVLDTDPEAQVVRAIEALAERVVTLGLA
ncbi:MAG: hypothetical protein ACR2G7_08355 [Acidimicrobiales bacterium]